MYNILIKIKSDIGHINEPGSLFAHILHNITEDSMNLEPVRTNVQPLATCPATLLSRKTLRFEKATPTGWEHAMARHTHLLRSILRSTGAVAIAIVLTMSCAWNALGVTAQDEIAHDKITSDTNASLPLAAPHLLLNTGSTNAVCLAMDAHGVLYLADEHAGTIRCMTRDGETATLISGLRSPCTVAVDHKRQLVVGTKTGELWRIQPDGKADLLGKSRSPILSVTIDRDGAAIAATASGDLIRIDMADK